MQTSGMMLLNAEPMAGAARRRDQFQAGVAPEWFRCLSRPPLAPIFGECCARFHLSYMMHPKVPWQVFGPGI